MIRCKYDLIYTDSFSDCSIDIYIIYLNYNNKINFHILYYNNVYSYIRNILIIKCLNLTNTPEIVYISLAIIL